MYALCTGNGFGDARGCLRIKIRVYGLDLSSALKENDRVRYNFMRYYLREPKLFFANRIIKFAVLFGPKAFRLSYFSLSVSPTLRDWLSSINTLPRGEKTHTFPYSLPSAIPERPDPLLGDRPRAGRTHLKKSPLSTVTGNEKVFFPSTCKRPSSGCVDVLQRHPSTLVRG